MFGVSLVFKDFPPLAEEPLFIGVRRNNLALHAFSTEP